MRNFSNIYKIGFIKSAVKRARIAFCREWWIFGLLVGKRYRGAGIGKILMDKAIGMAKRDGAKEIKLMVNTKSIPAINFYKKFGFAEVLFRGIDENPGKREAGYKKEYLAMMLKT
ncbi:MAG: hypothetical protein A3C43_08430 [Candidatus Schekmanbacteria bacterium RIFCSPHIGHO2_02_FULL_38_11]|uniref:N-acetyltransferase domain-containing protein n=1 Tax=Candidatus Schekmanbacteria bacterium RIFCSPLOWO2_12_FULL_38_15 TaxID=1817883 RepID=A0A1F7SEA2_9BACT|nr:MAG: hypothetical protein A2043_00985 [Candidatus Schekmanbacteria bacterium GWA2_38_9]OGL48966.1 MAG: hypothetical protein A3C43_08430 [Candidatus Schekmanbacteria bacterium RIFCSPHIGHO2_02_FULL_38_11]OGL49119.1 MAG: hypothetical protein A3H37_04075 [Candidatus Schekmanbacteria bacterium RIFCSPLOWO2_02_FULL_38_14]OGL52095.1 MAG: hypothetical protein A3G31_06660 [Candidatus Schekmanbacteria bacterium RIFCSPLOWO2_12_FULL_38_15]